MKRRRLAAAVVGGIAAAALGASGLAVAEQPTIKEMMGKNFAGLQILLSALIASNYEVVPAQVNLIHDHAIQLRQTIPDSAKADRDQFLTYAYNLQGSAAALKSIAEVLIEHDKAPGSGGKLATDQLREAAASHYGGMVTMCVACHNRFRQDVR